MEDYMPGVDVNIRRALSVPADILIDPALLLKPARVTGLAVDAGYKVAPKATSILVNLLEVLKQRGVRLLHPTAFKAESIVERSQQAPFQSMLPNLSTIARMMYVDIANSLKNPQLRRYVPERVRMYLKLIMPEGMHKWASSLAVKEFNRNAYVMHELEDVKRSFGRTVEDVLDDYDVNTDILQAYIDRYWPVWTNPNILKLLPPDVQEEVMKRMNAGGRTYRQTYPSPDAIKSLEGLRQLLESMRPRTVVEQVRQQVAASPPGQAIGQVANRTARFLAGEPLETIFSKEPWPDNRLLRSETIERLDKFSPVPLTTVYQTLPYLYAGMTNSFWRWLLMARLARTMMERMSSDSEQ
jgi:hypothetical protein